jgi:hypothetical protein
MSKSKSGRQYKHAAKKNACHISYFAHCDSGKIFSKNIGNALRRFISIKILL